MSEQQVLPLRPEVFSDPRVGLYCVAQQVEDRLNHLETSLAQSEAERERLQGELKEDRESVLRPHLNSIFSLQMQVMSLLADRDRHAINAVELMRQRDEAKIEFARERECNQRMRTAGQRMSNLLYNLSQQKRFIEPDAALMKDSVDEWDAAKPQPAPVVTGENQ